MADFELTNSATLDDVLEFPFGRGEIVDIGAPHFQYLISGRIGVGTADSTEFEAQRRAC